MKEHFWYEHWLSKHWVFYCGQISNFRIGLNIGLENDLYLGWFCIGLSKM